MRADKEVVVDEVWDDARIASFLDKAPLGDEDPAFSQLLYAYRSMRPDDFARFIDAFKARGGDTEARGQDGKTLREVISTHRKSAPFIAILDR
ncbi:MAG: PA4642 family protein [Pseudomonadales bacterium]